MQEWWRIVSLCSNQNCHADKSAGFPKCIWLTCIRNSFISFPCTPESCRGFSYNWIQRSLGKTEATCEWEGGWRKFLRRKGVRPHTRTILFLCVTNKANPVAAAAVLKCERLPNTPQRIVKQWILLPCKSAAKLRFSQHLTLFFFFLVNQTPLAFF